MTRAIVAALAIAASIPLAGQQGARDPRRDTATIAGRVLSTEAPPVPVRLARVMLTAVDRGGMNATATTDADGRFAFAALPSGRYLLQASKRAWLDASYGSSRIGRLGTPVAVTAGQQLTDLTIAMSRGAVIAGTVRDGRGDAQPGIAVRVMQFIVRNGARVLIRPNAFAEPISDSAGEYRAYGLPPGEYVVLATTGDSATRGIGSDVGIRRIAPGEVDRAMQIASPGGFPSAASGTRPSGPTTVGIAPVFFPGTTDLAAATTLTLVAGEERTGIDIAYAWYPTSRLYGLVVGFLPDSGRTRTELRLTPGGGEQFTSQPLAAGTARVGQDGKYVFGAVPPGRYTLMGIALDAPSGSGGPTIRGWAVTDVAIDGRDQELNLALGPASTLTGRMIFEHGTPPKGNEQIQIVVRAYGQATLLAPEQTVRPEPDGTFSLPSLVAGRYMIGALPPRDSPWTLKSAVIRNQDAADQPVEIPAGDSAVVVTFTDQVTELTGTLQDASGRPAAEYFVIVFPSDRGAWLPSSRRIQSTRPGNDGVYSVKGLPAGDYLISALTDVEPGEWFSPAFLEQLAASSLKVHIPDGGKTSVPLLQIKR